MDNDPREAGYGPDNMGDDEQETEVAEYEQYIEDPPDELLIAEDNDDDAEKAVDWAARHPRAAEADNEEGNEETARSAEESAIHEQPGQ